MTNAKASDFQRGSVDLIYGALFNVGSGEILSSTYSGRPITIALADKSPIVLAGLSAIFNEDSRFELKSASDDGESFLAAIDDFSPNIAIIGWNMPVLNGQGVLQALQERPLPPRVVVFTGNGGTDVPRMVMRLGGAGFCSKMERSEYLVETALSVAEGRMVFPFMDLTRVGVDPFSGLTSREQELLAALSQGRTNMQIAAELGISLNTVKFHLKNLYGKLDVRNRAQAVAYYLNLNHGA